MNRNMATAAIQITVHNGTPSIYKRIGGKLFDFTRPEAFDYRIETIAHSLSQICRFTGDTRVFYSVAQHSVHVSEILEPQYALAGLLHDAAEAFIGDISTPMKQMIPAIRDLEHRIEAALFPRFGLPPRLPIEVKRADLVMLVTEQRDLIEGGHMDIHNHEGIQPLPHRIVAWGPDEARRKFLGRFRELTCEPTCIAHP